MVLRPYLALKFGDLARHLPADVFPVLAGRSELLRFRAFPTVGLSNADRDDPGVDEREDQIAGRDLAHRFIEGIPRPVRVALRRPEITAPKFVAVCLVLVDPPIAHKVRRPTRPLSCLEDGMYRQRDWLSPLLGFQPFSYLREIDKRPLVCAVAD